MKALFSLLIFSSIFHCAGFTPDFSNNQFSERVQGVYESHYKNTVFEIWIEKANLPEGESLGGEINSIGVFVMVFEKRRRTEIEMLLRKYQDVERLAEDTCSYVESPAWGTHALWSAKEMGGLAGMSIPKNLEKNSKIPLNTLFYINFPVQEQYGFVSLKINNTGEAGKITFFETGFLKKPWNYFFNSSMQLQKMSKGAPHLLSQFYLNSNRVNQEAGKHSDNKASYCK